MHFFSDLATSRLILSTTLYYHVLEGTLLQEMKRLKDPNSDLSVRNKLQYHVAAYNFI